MRFYPKYGKRSLDVALALGGLVLCFPLLLAIALWMRLADGAPVLFCQPRVGRRKALFRIYKFRTMRADSSPDDTVTVLGDPRITPTGRWLRRFKLDELPQLFNVLKGDMSFVGPRPDVAGYLDRLEGGAARLLELRPGITGPATLAFRNEEQLLAASSDPKAFNDQVIFPEKVRLNLAYLEEVSLWKDLLCLWRTVVPHVERRNSATGAACTSLYRLRTPQACTAPRPAPRP